MKLIGSLVGILTLFGIFFGIHEYVENRYALKDALAQVQQNVTQVKRSIDYHIINQQREALEQRVEKIQETYKGKDMPKEAKELYTDLKKRLAEKEEELKAMEKK